MKEPTGTVIVFMLAIIALDLGMGGGLRSVAYICQCYVAIQVGRDILDVFVSLFKS